MPPSARSSRPKHRSSPALAQDFSQHNIQQSCLRTQSLLKKFCHTSCCSSLNLATATATAAATAAAGFFLFIGLAYYVYHHPPTPLALTHDHLDGLWHELAADVKGLHLGDKANALTHTLTDRWVSVLFCY
jgi:hypothetical protein